MDVSDILGEAMDLSVNRTQERIDAALDRARQAVAQQHELFAHAAGFDPEEAAGELQIGPEHVRAFVLGMFRCLHVEIVETLYDGEVLEIRLPDAMAQEVGSSRHRYRVGFDRKLRSARPPVEVMDLGSQIFSYLLERARSYEFGGHVAAVSGLSFQSLVTQMLRWQDTQGHRMRQEFTVLGLGDCGVDSNPAEVVQWLLDETVQEASSPPTTDSVQAERMLALARDAADRRLAHVSNDELIPENRELLGAVTVKRKLHPSHE